MKNHDRMIDALVIDIHTCGNMFAKSVFSGQPAETAHTSWLLRVLICGDCTYSECGRKDILATATISWPRNIVRCSRRQCLQFL